MPKNIKPLRREFVRLLEIEGVQFRVSLTPDGILSVSAKRHRTRYRRHIASMFPRLFREHGLVVESGLKLMSLREPHVRPFEPGDAGGRVIYASGEQQVFELEGRQPK